MNPAETTRWRWLAILGLVLLCVRPVSFWLHASHPAVPVADDGAAPATLGLSPTLPSVPELEHHCERCSLCLLSSLAFTAVGRPADVDHLGVEVYSRSSDTSERRPFRSLDWAIALARAPPDLSW